MTADRELLQDALRFVNASHPYDSYGGVDRFDLSNRLTARLAQPEPDAGVEDAYSEWNQAEGRIGEYPAFQAGYEAALRSRSAGATVGVPDAYSFELATLRNHGTGEYSGWEPRLSSTEPHVSGGAIRNLRPLYAAPPAPAPVAVGVPEAIESLAERLHFEMQRLDPDIDDGEWSELSDSYKEFFRQGVKAVLSKPAMVRAALSAAPPAPAPLAVNVEDRLATHTKMVEKYPILSTPRTRYRIEHDGFVGTVIGHYTRLDGYSGKVLQQDGTKVVHVYGDKWLKPAEELKGFQPIPGNAGYYDDPPYAPPPQDEETGR